MFAHKRMLLGSVRRVSFSGSVDAGVKTAVGLDVEAAEAEESAVSDACALETAESDGEATLCL